MTTRNTSDLAVNTTNPNLANEVTTFENVDTRDDRFKHLLYQQFGETGIVSLVNQALIFVLALIMIVSIMIGMIAANVNTGYSSSASNYLQRNSITTMNLGQPSQLYYPSSAAISL